MREPKLSHLDGPMTLSRFEEIQEIYAAAFPTYRLDDHRWRTVQQAEAPGFGAVIAHLSRRIVGVVYGLPLSSRTGWWDGLEPTQEAGFTVETGDRTFAVIDLAVLPIHRGHGLGRRLMDELLRSRSEDRATLATDPQDIAVQAMYERWGWHKVGRTPGGERMTEAEFDVYVIDLRVEGTASKSR